MTLLDIIKRIKQLYGVKKDAEVASLLNFSRSALAERKRNNSIPYHEIVRLSEQKNASIDWLLTGKGTMLLEEAPPRHELLAEILNEVKDMPELKEDIKVKELGFNITLNEDNQMIITSFKIKVEGKDKDGINHDMVVKGSVEIEGIDESVVDTIDLSDKEVTVIECQTNK